MNPNQPKPTARVTSEERDRLIELRDAINESLDGRSVEVSQKGKCKWGVASAPHFDFASYDYRPIPNGCADQPMPHTTSTEPLSKACADTETHAELAANQREQIIAEWKGVLALFRSYEKDQIISKKPSPDTLQKHLACINRMIMLADSIVQVSERFIDVNYHLESTDRAKLESEIALLKCHKETLAFEFRDWTPTMNESELSEATQGFFGESADQPPN